MDKEKIMSTEQETGQAWETGDLGRDEKHVRRSTGDSDRAVEDALELQMISIRLQKELIEQLKFLAQYHGVGYQPLIRDVLARWARSEMLLVANQMQKELEAKEMIKKASGKCA
jgi:hypothetical protein